MIDQGELFVIPNPCRGICTVNNRGYCKGCLRSRKERFHWHEFSPFHQQLIINVCEKRRLKIIAAKTAQPEEEFEEVIPQLDMFTISHNIKAITPPNITSVTSITKRLDPVIFTPSAIPEPAIEALTQAVTLPVQDGSDADSKQEHSEPEQSEKQRVKEKQTNVKQTKIRAPKKSKPAPPNDQFDLF